MNKQTVGQMFAWAGLGITGVGIYTAFGVPLALAWAGVWLFIIGIGTAMDESDSNE